MKKLGFILGLAVLLHSCVAKKKFDELEEKYFTQRADFEALQEENDSLKNALMLYENRCAKVETELTTLREQYETLKRLYETTDKAYKNLQASYDALSKKSTVALEAQSVKMRDLIRELEAKEKKLAEEEQKLEKLKEDLDKKAERIAKLEALIQEKEAILNRVKSSLTASLKEFENQGLSVKMKNGKLYVSMQNKLLFDSGSWKLKSRGTDAIRIISRVLADNPDVEIMIEGHTDNVPYHGNAFIQDNWDLSVKRATTVVRQLLKNKQIDPKRLIAAGRSKYHPVAPNTTPEGRAKNRRIEVILTPNMDKLMQLLEQSE